MSRRAACNRSGARCSSVWDSAQRRLDSPIAAAAWNPNEDYGSDAYFHLSADWLWHRFVRALHAHASGDDPLALADLRFLATARFVMSDRVSARCSPPASTRGGIPLRFGFLVPQLDSLLADHEQRARMTARRDADTIRDTPTRIAARIEQLAFASPHLIALGDPYLAALALEGEDASE
ncbi:MAG: hypothetical protein WCJ30_19310, partial [Deltaproteobacteria bacterium]